MTLKIKCSYVAEGEPFTLGRTYTIYCESATTGLYYIKDDSGRNVPYRHVDDIAVIDGLLRNLNDVWHSHFTTCNQPEPKQKKERTPKEKVQILLEKAVDYIYNNQEELNISLDDFVTLIRIMEEQK
jgi:hypothetical protein|nr:MAG TPA: hypothetical protein [Caudoviricetes sp.]